MCDAVDRDGPPESPLAKWERDLIATPKSTGHHPPTGVAVIWHAAYCRWYDNDRAGNARRAKAWGWVADRLARR